MERWQKPEAEPPPHEGTTDHDHPCTRSSLDYTMPLRSIIRGDAAAAAPSPFFKLSAELSREPLRIPGTVPFMWEQSPGRRKFASTLIKASASVRPPAISPQPQSCSSFSPECSSTATVHSKPSLASLFRQSSLKSVASAADSWPIPPSASPDLPHISPPPAADQTRSSSARYSLVMQRKVPSHPSIHNASVHGNGDDGVGTLQSDGEDLSETVTAMAGDGLSTMEDGLLLSGPLRPASTPSEARDFIMNRFLPAAHTIACESPQTPSRRFALPAGVAGGPDSPATLGRSNGSFRDHVATSATACRPSPLRYASASSMPASNYNAMQLRCNGQQCRGSFYGGKVEEDEDDEEDDAEEDAPFTSKACGIFPIHVNLRLHNWRRGSNKCPSPKHQHITKQQHRRKLPTRSPHYMGSRTRIMDILHDDQSSSHGDESIVHPLKLYQLEVERERNKTAALERNRLMYPSIGPRAPSDSSNYRESPNLYHGHRAASELYSEEASEYGSFQDAPSRFHTPSPAALQHNTRTSRAYGLQFVSGNAQTSLSFAGLQDGHPSSAAMISTTEQHLLNSSFYNYNIHKSIKKPNYLQARVASPCAHHTHFTSHVGASPRQSCAYHDNCSSMSYNYDTANNKPLEKPEHPGIPSTSEQWDTECHSFTQKTHVINNVLYEHEDSEINNANSTSMLLAIDAHVAKYSAKGTRLQNQGTSAPTERGHGGCPYGYGGTCMDQDAYHICESDRGSRNRCVCKEDHANPVNQCVSKGEHSGDHNQHHVSNGNHHGTDGSHRGDGTYHCYYPSRDDSPYMVNGDNLNMDNGNSYASKSLLSPPLPKSPTHSWLDRAMPLLASTSKGQGASSRFSHMHKAATSPADQEVPVSMTTLRKQPPALSSAAEASKWEALVRGSHRQPGHLRFSEELFNQSQTIPKVAAS